MKKNNSVFDKKERLNSPHFIYGPVPSRRLGFSLGVDILPFKTCPFDCIYCQLGRTTEKTIQRKEFIPHKEVLHQIKKAITSGQKIDYITFSGSGEPTLNQALGKLIREIKKITAIPVAVLTNSSLLTRKDVRKALQAADLVVPSLDAASQEVFVRTNRPHLSLRAGKIINGLIHFRKEFKGPIWLEIMLVKGINDTKVHLEELKKAIARIGPDKVHLNTVVRPPAEKFARPLSEREMERTRKILGDNCQVIADFKKRKQKATRESLEQAILSMVQRRPVTLKDISFSLGKPSEEILRPLDALLETGKIKAVRRGSSIYYLKS
jgi:wyosine [tRNA(Phe)-imidazoG37] synthetase (radical SAM superfamily)